MSTDSRDRLRLLSYVLIALGAAIFLASALLVHNVRLASLGWVLGVIGILVHLSLFFSRFSKTSDVVRSRESPSGTLTYRMEFGALSRLGFALAVAVLAAALVLLALDLSRVPDDTSAEAVFLVACVGFTLYLSYKIISLPYKVVVDQGGDIQFESLLRNRRMAVSSIEWASVAVDWGFLVLRHSTGRVTLVGLRSDLLRLLDSLKERHPDLSIRRWGLSVRRGD